MQLLDVTPKNGTTRRSRTNPQCDDGLQYGTLPLGESIPLPPGEEVINAAIHGFGFMLSLLGTASLVAAWRGGLGGTGLAVACGVYAVTLSVVYAISTLSHAVQRPQPKHVLQTWDQGAIYLLIVGTYTPFAWAFLPSRSIGLFLAAIWTAALLGFYSKVVARHRVHHTFSTVSYIALGWVPALPLVGLVPMDCVIWMAIGGVSYTAGTWFLKRDRRYRYSHAVWHVCVIIGSACHYYGVVAFIMLRGAAGGVPQ